MSVSAIVISGVIGMIIVLIGTVYAGLYFAKKSAEKRRSSDEQLRK